MSVIRITVLVVLLVFETRRANSQGSFVNLDFESPVLPLIPLSGTSRVPITNAVPGWRALIGGVEDSRVAYNAIALDAAAISLHDSRSITPAFDGNYSVFLQPSSRFAPQQAAAALGQTGLVRQDARSLFFYTKPMPFPPPVTFAGETISLTPIGAATATYQVWGGDISRYAGQVGELRFTVNPGGGGAWLDNIQFSSNPVPEPGAWALFGLGSALLFCGIRRKQKWSTSARGKYGHPPKAKFTVTE